MKKFLELKDINAYRFNFDLSNKDYPKKSIILSILLMRNYQYNNMAI